MHGGARMRTVHAFLAIARLVLRDKESVTSSQQNRRRLRNRARHERERARLLIDHDHSPKLPIAGRAAATYQQHVMIKLAGRSS